MAGLAVEYFPRSPSAAASGSDRASTPDMDPAVPPPPDNPSGLRGVREDIAPSLSLSPAVTHGPLNGKINNARNAVPNRTTSDTNNAEGSRERGPRGVRVRDAGLVHDRHLPPGDGAHHRRARAPAQDAARQVAPHRGASREIFPHRRRRRPDTLHSAPFAPFAAGYPQHARRGARVRGRGRVRGCAQGAFQGVPREPSPRRGARPRRRSFSPRASSGTLPPARLD